jgi:hypothetical protein
MKNFFRFHYLLLLALIIPLQACATYSAKDIHGQVVDDATGAPLDGVVIVAQWLLERSMVGDNNALLKVMETVSDKNGNYTFPAWGPSRYLHGPIFGQAEIRELCISKSGIGQNTSKTNYSATFVTVLRPWASSVAMGRLCD